MLEVYLGNNANTNQDLLTILTTYGVTYRCIKACDVNRVLFFCTFRKPFEIKLSKGLSVVF